MMKISRRFFGTAPSKFPQSSLLPREEVANRIGEIIFANSSFTKPSYLPHAISNCATPKSNLVGEFFAGKHLTADLGMDSFQRRDFLTAVFGEFCVPVSKDADNLLDFTSLVNYFSSNPKAR